MKIPGKTIWNIFARRKHIGDELPLRLGLFNAEQREEHGRILASKHRLKTGRSRERLLVRLVENENLLIGAHNVLINDLKTERSVTPAGEWLLDNFYVIEEQIRTARQHLPKGYSQGLPCLSSSLSAGLPRVYDIALETILHGDGRVDPEGLKSFVSAYQSVNSLKLGELWAIPIMLRLGIIENLRRVATLIAANRFEKILAGEWAERMIAASSEEPSALIGVIADMVRSTPVLTTAFVAELTRRVKGSRSALELSLMWLSGQLSEMNLTVEQSINTENQLQAGYQVSMANCIGSLRVIDAMDWRTFVEEMSAVEHTLSKDPAGVYAGMDFTTRDRYRHRVEKVAKECANSEEQVAALVLQLATEAAARTGVQDRSAHVGFYLIDKGLEELERRVGVRFAPRGVLRGICRRSPLSIYAASAAFITVFITYGLLSKAAGDGAYGASFLPLGLLLALCVGDMAIALTNWLATLLVTPYPLPRMDFSKGIPEDLRTLVVIPAMLTDASAIGNLVGALEIRFLGNRDKRLHFALLTDFCDSPCECAPEDGPLLQLAVSKIEGLNEKYRHPEDGVFSAFFLFHRPRRWNPQEGVWMGRERKRGKLSDLNGFLRDETKYAECFSVVVGDVAILTEIQYVITLDADTQLARDTAQQFVGAMAHPLNRPRYDEKQGRVVEGYGILQPRVAMTLPSAHRSLFARMSVSEIGIDPYTRAVSDVYQDLFKEGSFIGKGIYSVDAFRQATDGRFPENRILSHDLLEGCYARAGLLSDVQLYEKFPSRYAADVARRRRWIRGDWQIASWVLPLVPAPASGRLKNPLSPLSRWKIFDNLRRSLTAATMTAMLLLAWFALPSPGFWTAVAAGVMLIPSLVPSIFSFLNKSADRTLRQQILSSTSQIARSCAQVCFSLACLPYEAFYSLGAMTLALWRMTITHKQLLQWNPSDDADKGARAGLGASLKEMWIGPFAAVLAASALAACSPSALPAALPILALWLLSPAAAWRISSTSIQRHEKLSPAQHQFLRRIARHTWGFFETFVGPEDNWLPPDNYQEYPVERTAHRTSPTNIGLALLANLSAYDFGFISAGKLIDRTAHTFATMGALRRHRGHFFNWYDTLTLDPLPPLYISSVDSGNLAGHLLTLRSGLRELADRKILEPKIFKSLHDLLEMASSHCVAQNAATLGIEGLSRDLRSITQEPPVTLTGLRASFERLADSASALTGREDISQDSQDILDSFIRQCRDALGELRHLAPWVWERLESMELAALDEIPTLRELGNLDNPDSLAFQKTEGKALKRFVEEGARRARERTRDIDALEIKCGAFSQIEYGFLYDETRHLLSIGYNVSELRRDPSCYDLLASEARQAVFVGIAQGLLPQESWFALGRRLAAAGGEQILLSWSGSMFEYLMPLLVMPAYDHTLLDETCRASVSRQIAYGKKLSLPWGISECGYNSFDVHQDYQYHAFGAPGLGLKRGLAEDLVIAPYASLLALMVAPEEACRNLERLSAEGLEARYGFYEAVDYTPSRLQRGHSCAVVQSFMAHHQGMGFLALNHLLLGRPMHRRFESEPLFKATLTLLQEKIPEATARRAHMAAYPEFRKTATGEETTSRVFDRPDTPYPETLLMSNGKYHVMITNAGGGYSRWNDMAITRWREDATSDNWGSFCYLRDVKTGEFWSTTHQPTLKQAQFFEAAFSEGRAEFHCRHCNYDSHSTIVVSPEDDIELRRTRLSNRAFTRRFLEATSFAEVVLAPPAGDDLHTAFSNLFVQTEILRGQGAILCTRRPRSEGELSPWMFHMMIVHDAEPGEISYETDRARFIGRGRSLVDPEVMDEKIETLSGSEGSVLDPAVSVRCRIFIEAEGTATIDIISGVAETREAALRLVEKYHDRSLADRVFDMAWTHSQVLLRQLNASEADAQLYNRLAGSIIYAGASRRADAAVLAKNNRGQSGLWGYSISGDLPIVLLHIEDPENINLVHQLLQAHAYWRLKGLAVDLVIWDEDRAGYRQLLHDQVLELVGAEDTTRRGGVFVRQADRIAEEDRILIQAVARAVISDARGTLGEQIRGRTPKDIGVSRHPKRYVRETEIPTVALQPRDDLLFYNGLGGFTSDGREYVITTARGRTTPMPWANVLANPNFGTVVSENGLAYTWGENAHEFRLTPWGNDPVNDSKGEAFYLRDEQSGYFWSPTPQPCCGDTPYVTRHGFGYSVFEHNERGIRSEMQVYVALDASVKFIIIKVSNISGRARSLSATGYVEWVLGDLRPKTAMHVVTERDANSGAIFARNPYNTEFPERTAFFDIDDRGASVTCDRTEFLGRNGTLSSPAAMGRERLSGRVGAGLDPCG
ncbi:MAG: hypothetical protein LBQ36_10085, partial [Synergistaceae bacterium]|nr:hypothetical protein [Synergistaceae bacterium]